MKSTFPAGLGSMQGARPKDCWPTPEQDLLLEAALGSGRPAVAAWHAWTGAVNLDDIDPGSYRLIPLLYSNLVRNGVQDSVLQKYKGVYRNAWYRNQVLFNRLAGILSLFRAEKIQTMLVKGVALATLYYSRIGMRPMSDADVLIRPDDLSRATAILNAHGWQCAHPAPHAASFTHPDGFSIDLHWRLTVEHSYGDSDAAFWKRAESTEFLGIPTQTLSPADHLLHACAHGARGCQVPPLRWLADAAAIIKKRPDLDWAQLVSSTEELDLVLPVRDTLDYLRSQRFDIPEPFYSRLKNSLVSAEELKSYRIRCQSYQTGAEIFRLMWFDYKRSCRAQNRLPRLTGFPDFLRTIWVLRSSWEVPVFIIRKGIKRLFRAV